MKVAKLDSEVYTATLIEMMRPLRPQGKLLPYLETHLLRRGTSVGLVAMSGACTNGVVVGLSNRIFQMTQQAFSFLYGCNIFD